MRNILIFGLLLIMTIFNVGCAGQNDDHMPIDDEIIIIDNQGPIKQLPDGVEPDLVDFEEVIDETVVGDETEEIEVPSIEDSETIHHKKRGKVFNCFKKDRFYKCLVKFHKK